MAATRSYSYISYTVTQLHSYRGCNSCNSRNSRNKMRAQRAKMKVKSRKFLILIKKPYLCKK